MLSESERQSLSEIERMLAMEEPALAQTLVVGRPHGSWLHIALAATFGVLGVLLLVLGPVGAALACFGCAAVAMLLRGFTWT
ncbi:DUF3040 domain-containing protein [Umezawaea beigongshangensis]|jgi:hypothetical protein|uniref:DUF3040 domain-containing protein n=1 Tax=Umezawaea beigongshangensis TaxID=2780383 RepID=UPI0018F1F4AE|nr:DUF3040 domain-containing protein [Umezawaea beigongshangensis]